jgi:AcrR family transcriptional regulator
MVETDHFRRKRRAIGPDSASRAGGKPGIRMFGSGLVFSYGARVLIYTEGASAFQGARDGKTDRMTDQAAESTRRPRADAVRNRERVLEAAKAVFSAGGPEASLEAVARQAGVGIGTLYRHFPTRAALLAEVYQREVEQLDEAADRLLAEKPPIEALELWFEELIAYMATKRMVGPALRADPDVGAKVFAAGGPSIRNSFRRLTDAAARAGEIRGDLDDDDLQRLLTGFAHGYDQPGWESGARRMLSIMMAGLRSSR